MFRNLPAIWLTSIVDLAEHSKQSSGTVNHTHHPGHHDVDLWLPSVPHSIPCDWSLSWPGLTVPKQTLFLYDYIDNLLDRQETEEGIHSGHDRGVCVSVPTGPKHDFSGHSPICPPSSSVYTAFLCHGVSPPQQVLARECGSLSQCKPRHHVLQTAHSSAQRDTEFGLRWRQIRWGKLTA